MIFKERKLIFEKGSPGRKGTVLPRQDVPECDAKTVLGADVIRDEIKDFPELSEVEIVRHYTQLSHWNYAIDDGIYPLGSCTMKYNPKINEELVRLPMPADLHPFLPSGEVQGLLCLMHELAAFLGEISGMDHVTLQPAAGAHGELLGMMLIKAYHDDRGDSGRKRVLIPVSAHGTNPASCALCGFTPVELAADEHGCVDMSALEKLLGDNLAGIMITNPNTLGIFEENIVKICELVHGSGGLVYMDGANLNALMGLCRPGDMGIDVMHFNLHKTFSTPHGGGGPGSGPVGVKQILEPYLPVPVLEKKDTQYFLDFNRRKTVGKLHAFYGNVGIMVRAYAYIRSLGPEGLKRISETAIVNANYIKEKLRPYYHLPYDRVCKHECVFTDKWQNEYHVKTLDIAKRLIDYGFHPPTVYFPLLVSGAIMIEPTESENRESLDEFIDAMIAIADEAKNTPEKVTAAPSRLPVSRLDETTAARTPVLRWKK